MAGRGVGMNISKNTLPPQVQLQNTMSLQMQMLENHSHPPPPPYEKNM